jgi:hypothetical protein
MSVDRGWCDQVAFAVGGLDLLRFEIAAPAIFLNGANPQVIRVRQVPKVEIASRYCTSLYGASVAKTMESKAATTILRLDSSKS